MTISLRRAVLTLIPVLTAIVLVAGWYVHGTASQEKHEPKGEGSADVQWEYLIVAGGQLSVDSSGYGRGRKQKVFPAEASAVERNLDSLGEEGWELVTVTGTNQPAFFLKRPKKR